MIHIPTFNYSDKGLATVSVQKCPLVNPNGNYESLTYQRPFAKVHVCRQLILTLRVVVKQNGGVMIMHTSTK